MAPLRTCRGLDLPTCALRTTRCAQDQPWVTLWGDRQEGTAASALGLALALALALEPVLAVQHQREVLPP